MNYHGLSIRVEQLLACIHGLMCEPITSNAATRWHDFCGGDNEWLM